MINIKTKDEVSKIARSGKIASFVLKELAKYVKPGVTTFELDKIASRIISSRGAKPSFLNYNGFPAVTCISINSEVVHGIPSQRKIMHNDLVKIDVGVELDGFHSDTATTILVGKPSSDTLRLINGTKKALEESIKIISPGIRVGAIEEKTGEILEKHGLSPVMSLSGHGIGKSIHEEPSIKSNGKSNQGEVVKEGMVFAIEPMATLGSGKVKTSQDGWTIVSSDNTLAAHFEHTVVVAKNGAKILT